MARKTDSRPKRKKVRVNRNSADQVQSLSRALALLNSVAQAPAGGSRLSDLAQEVGLAPSTAHRLLSTLQQQRFVRFDGETRVWSIGVQAFVTGCAFTKSRSLVGLARGHMRTLMENSGETVNLAMENEGEAMYLAQVECQQMMRVFARPGMRVPLHCSAVGKAMLSTMPQKQLVKILHRQGMVRLTVKTITIPSELHRNLELVHKRGYALDDEEHALGLRCIAAPIFDENGACVGAISTSGPTVRIDQERARQLGAMVLDAARSISEEMGWTSLHSHVH